jgi:hypothetical protein
MRTVGLELVILDEVDPGLDQGADLLGGRFRREADARLDDRADDRTVEHARQPARAGDTELRPLIAVEKFGRQLQVDQPQPGKRLELAEIAVDRRQEIGEREPHVRHRPGQGHACGAAGGVARFGQTRPRQRRCRDLAQFDQVLDPRGMRLAQFVSLAGHPDERAGRLLAGHRFRRLLQRESGLDPVSCGDPRFGHQAVLK